MNKEELIPTTKDELIKLIETLTESQIEYLFHLTQLLFGQSAN